MRRQAAARRYLESPAGPNPGTSRPPIALARTLYGPPAPRSHTSPRAAPTAAQMAGTRFAYVKNFELPDPLLPGTYILLRLDGHGFHRYGPRIPAARAS